MSGSVVSMPNRADFMQSVVNRLNKINGRIQWIVFNEYTSNDWEILPLEIHTLLLDLVEFDNKLRTKRVVTDKQIKIPMDSHRDTKFTPLIDWVERFRELVLVVHVKQWERGTTAFLYQHERREWAFLQPMFTEIMVMASKLADSKGGGND